MAPGSFWVTDDNDPLGEINAEMKLSDGWTIWPIQRVIKRFENGPEDSVYVYGYKLTEKILNEPFDQAYWTMQRESMLKKPWWKLW